MIDSRSADPAVPPVAIAFIAGSLFAAPLLQIVAAITGWHIGNFGTTRWANWPIYLAAAPFAGWLLWSGHPRARFAAYILLTTEALRSVRALVRIPNAPGAWSTLVVAIAIIIALQLPSARRFCPSLRPSEIRSRLRQRFGLNPSKPGCPLK